MDDVALDEGCNMREDSGMAFGDDDPYRVDFLADIGMIEFLNVSGVEVDRFHFGDLEVAFEFYNQFAKLRGFSARKSKTQKNNNLEVVKQIFVCSHQGFRPEELYSMENRKKEPRAETRCGCNTRFEAHLELASSKWYVTYFSDGHNYKHLEPRLTGMLLGHRKIMEVEIGQINNMRKAGISTSQIYRLLASQTGGYEYVGFGARDIYNQIAK